MEVVQVPLNCQRRTRIHLHAFQSRAPGHDSVPFFRTGPTRASSWPFNFSCEVHLRSRWSSAALSSILARQQQRVSQFSSVSWLRAALGTMGLCGCRGPQLSTTLRQGWILCAPSCRTGTCGTNDELSQKNTRCHFGRPACWFWMQNRAEKGSSRRQLASLSVKAT